MQNSMKWSELTTEEKINFKKFCDNKYGETIVKSEIGQPLYIDECGNLIDTTIILDLLFNIVYN